MAVEEEHLKKLENERERITNELKKENEVYNFDLCSHSMFNLGLGFLQSAERLLKIHKRKSE